MYHPTIEGLENKLNVSEHIVLNSAVLNLLTVNIQGDKKL